MIISKNIHPLNPLTQNHLPDQELRFHRFVVQLLQFRMSINMTFQLTQHFFVNSRCLISTLFRASLMVLNYKRGFSHWTPSLDEFFAQLTQISFLHSSRSKNPPITVLFQPAFLGKLPLFSLLHYLLLLLKCFR